MSDEFGWTAIDESSTIDHFLFTYRVTTGEWPRRWKNPDGTPSQWFVHKGVLYERS